MNTPRRAAGTAPKTAAKSRPLTLQLEADNTHLANLCGPLDENLRQIAQAYGVEIGRRGNRYTLRRAQARPAARALRWFHERAAQAPLSLDTLQLGLVELGARSGTPPDGAPDLPELPPVDDASLSLRTRKTDLRPRTPRQRDYLNAILKHDVTFGVGPAGTGKTWLAVACAIDALERESVSRLVLTRPAVEAGERLGFLPGDLVQKVDPYLRPLYDALNDMLDIDKAQALLERGQIEVAPLAFMRGRTLNNAVVILDEAQNTTRGQMKMFLTRLGHGSKMIVTGDPTQIDLPDPRDSGVIDAARRLQRTPGVGFVALDRRDVVRHPLVQRVIDAYGDDRDAEMREEAMDEVER